MKDSLLKLTDLLIRKKDIESLTALRSVVAKFHASGFVIPDLSLIELNEYIDEAISAIKTNKIPNDILKLPIRRLLDK